MYTFVKYNGGWWLKVSSLEEYIDISVFENQKWNEAADQLGDYKHDKRFHYTNGIASLIADFRCYRTGRGIIKETQSLIEEIASKQLEMISKHGSIYINKNGGYCFGIKEEEKVKLDKMVYPDNDYYQIDIKKFPYGVHYYLYINGKQVYDTFGNAKWNTYERAKEIADKYIQNETI